MSETILNGDFTVYFGGDLGGSRQIRWTGSTGTYTMVEFYSALMDLFDDDTAGVGFYMDHAIPIFAITPTSYRFGLIGAGADEAWFIDPVTIQHLTGGAIETRRWSRVEGTTIGIIKVLYDPSGGSEFVSSDIGKTVTTTSDGDSGVLLYFDSNLGEAWIRPDTDTSADSFDLIPTSFDQITVTGGTGDVTQIFTSTTGEMLWSNIFTIGTLVANTRVYVTQENQEIENFWGDGQIDILVLIRDQGTFIDDGRLKIFARQFTKTYDHFITDVSGGGRTAIPLSTGTDLNNAVGYRSLNVSGASFAFTAGEVVTGGNGAIGVVTGNTGDPTTSFVYYLISDTDIDFVDTTSLTGSIVGSNGTASGAPSNTGPALYTDVTVTAGWTGNSTYDINQDTIFENYSIVIDCNNRALSQVYQRLKYITRRGEQGLIAGIEGFQYIGTDYRIDYQYINGTINDGDTVKQQINRTGPSIATSYVVGHNTIDQYLMLRDTLGTYVTTEPVSIGDFIGYQSNSVRFSGDYLERTSDLIGNSNGTQLTFSFWFVHGFSTDRHFYYGGSSDTVYGVEIEFTENGDITIRGKNTSDTVVFEVDRNDTFDDGTRRHMLFSMDLSSTSLRHMYVDDVDTSFNASTYDTAETIDFTQPNHWVGSGWQGTNIYTGNITDFWMDFGTYLDLDIEANRRKFISDTGIPVFLGSDGSFPTGSPPLIFFTGNTDDWHINRGSGGDFTENGGLTDAVTQIDGGATVPDYVDPTTIEQITPNKQSPLGSFAGGRYFGARGIVLDNVPVSDANNYELVDDDGNIVTEPVFVNFQISGLRTDSEVRIYDVSDDSQVTGTENTTSVLTSVTISNGGSGYSVSDVLTLVGGSFTTAATLTVTSISGGIIDGVSIANPGTAYTADPATPTSVTGGTGTGATFNTIFTGTFVYQYTYASDITTYIVIFHLNFKDIRLEGTILGDENQSIPIQQIRDRVYSNL